MNGVEAERDDPNGGKEGDDEAKGGDKLIKEGGGDMLAEGEEEADQADRVEGEMLPEGGEGEMLAEGRAYQAEGREEGDEMMAAELVIGIEKPLN